MKLHDSPEVLGYLGVREASRRFASRDCSPLELLHAVLERISNTEPSVHAYVQLMRDSAIDEAASAEARVLRGETKGPLDGIPVAVKDLFDTAGVVTSGGSAAYRDRVPTADAFAIQRLREAGAVIIGKTNTHELAMGGTTKNPHYGNTHNPWNLEYVPGGSSGGSAAALAAGQCLGALGSDTGGSIRIPAAFCGVSGFKPTYGLVSRTGMMALSPTQDHAGPMARSADDISLILGVIAGFDSRDLDCEESGGYDASTMNQPLGDICLGVIESWLDSCQPAVATNFRAALGVFSNLGARIESFEPPGGKEDRRTGLESILQAEASLSHLEALQNSPDGISEPHRRWLEAGLEIRATEYAAALQARRVLERQFDQAVAAFDAVLLPTSPATAELIAGKTNREKFRFTSLFNSTRGPAVSIPNGFDERRLPTGLQIAGAKLRDALVLRVAHTYQQVTEFHLARPQLIDPAERSLS